MKRISKSAGNVLKTNQGKMSSAHVLTQPGYKTKPLEAAKGQAADLMRKGSFANPVKPKGIGPWG